MATLIFPTTTSAGLTLVDALDAIDRASSSEARLRAVATWVKGAGFGGVHVVQRGDGCAPLAEAQLIADPRAMAPDGAMALPGVVWRRRLAAAEHYRGADGLYLLDGSDPWVTREVWGDVDARPPQPPTVWHAYDVLIGVAADRHERVHATLCAWAPEDERRPGPTWRRELSLLLRHLGAALAHDRLADLAQRRAARLHRLQEVGAMLARSLDEHEIVAELARQALRATHADGVLVSVPDLEQGTATPLARIVREREHEMSTMPLGDGLVRAVAQRGAPVFLDDAGGALANDVLAEIGPAGSALGVPLLVAGKLLAVLVVHATVPGRFDGEDTEVLSTMASQAATAIANARRYADSERARRQTEALADVARAVSESLRPGEVMRLILRHAVALLRADGACLALRDGDWMRVVAGVGAAELLPGVHLPVAESLLGRATRDGERIVANALDQEGGAHRFVRELARMQRAVVAPLSTPRGIIGAIAVVDREAPFTEEDARILQRLADQVAVALANARLFDEVERATREWKSALDAIPSGLVVLDAEQRIERCNRAMAELCASPTIPSLLGRSFPDVLAPDAESAQRLRALLQEARTHDRPLAGVLRTQDGMRVFDALVMAHADGGAVVTVTLRVEASDV